MNILICTFLALLQFVEILFSSSKCISFICWASHAHSLLFRDIRGRTITPSTRTQFRIVSYPIREPSLFHISHIHIFFNLLSENRLPTFFSRYFTIFPIQMDSLCVSRSVGGYLQSQTHPDTPKYSSPTQYINIILQFHDIHISIITQFHIYSPKLTQPNIYLVNYI